MTKKNKIIFGSQHGYFGEKDESEHLDDTKKLIVT